MNTRAKESAMQSFSDSWRSSVGIKAWVAVSGVLLWVWIALHALGLLSVFAGPAAIDGYSALLHGRPALLWTMRAGLLLVAAVHVRATLLLARRARVASRGRTWTSVRYLHTSLVSRGMRAGGVGLLAFVVLHVLHMTLGLSQPLFVPSHVHANLARGLASPWVACGYIAAAVALSLHLLHGLWSAPRSLGFGAGADLGRARALVACVAVALVVSFAAVPIAVLAGVVR
jgi:succinate dehydrogenase / fumarate reductase cytochrome b subunit